MGRQGDEKRGDTMMPNFQLLPRVPVSPRPRVFFSYPPRVSASLRLRVLLPLTVVGLLLVAVACKSPTATPQAIPTITPTIAPIATAVPDTAEPPPPSVTPSASAHLSFVLNLTGAIPVDGDYEEDMGGDFSCGKGPFYEIFGAPIPSASGGEVNFAIAPSSILTMKPGDTIQLTNGGDIVVSVGDQDFTLASSSSATMQVSKNGSGSLTFKNLVATTDTSQKESGTVTWTCKQ